MDDPGEAVFFALADQGFGLIWGEEEEVTILSLDRRRLHRIPTAYFERNALRYRQSLRLLVIGLELMEGFIPPEGLWED